MSRLAAQCRGFTLLEVLVAMMVIAVALAAIIKTTGAGAANAAYLRDKTFAHWVAMNQMAELQVAQTFPSLGEKSGEEEMANRTWYWSRKVKTTDLEDIRRVEISVRLERNKNAAALTSVTGFFTKYVSREDDERREDDEGRGNDKEEGKITEAEG